MEKGKASISKSIEFSPLEERLAVMQNNQKLFIGFPKANQKEEKRIAITPQSVNLLSNNGHRIVIEKGAGNTAGFSDYEYSEAGAEITADIKKIYDAHFIIKAGYLDVEEIEHMKLNQTILCPLQLPKMTDEIIRRLSQKKITALAFEFIKDEVKSYPFVRTLSEIAGYSSILIASEFLNNSKNGKGVLIGGITGAPPTKVVILGAGVVGEFAARAALGFGAEVKIFDNTIYKLMRLQNNIGQRIFTSILDPTILAKELEEADIAIGAIHSETGRSPIIVTEEMVKNMKSGSVVIDVSIDQGGCFETSEITSHEKPIVVKHDVIHYGVPNIASRVSHTASEAISNVLTPMLLKMGNFNSLDSLLIANKGIRKGVYMYKGLLTNKYMSELFEIKYKDLDLLMAANF